MLFYHRLFQVLFQYNRLFIKINNKLFVHVVFFSPQVFPMATVTQFVILLFLLPCSLATKDHLVITTKDGEVKGKLVPVLHGKVRAFLGIPYAKPPVGNMRFRAPEPVEGWKEVKDATKYSNTCYQIKDTTFPGRISVFTGHLCLVRWP